MNTPESREGNFIRYVVYFIGYLMAAGVVKLVTMKSPLKIWDIILFVLIAAMVLLFYVYRFNREQRFFERSFVMPWLGNYAATIGLTLVVVATRIGVSWLQAYNKISWYDFQAQYLKHESVPMFWFLIAAIGVVLPILQQFLTNGFFFNYAFRKSDPGVALVGMVCSGLLFSILNFQTSIPLFVINLAYGMLFAWSYLYTQTLWMPIYLSIVNGVLLVIMT